MKKFFLFLGLVFMAVFLSSCGYEGHYRYPCQDPANWENEECKPPVCTVNGACPEDLVDLDQLQNNADETVVDEITQDGETANG